MKRLLLPAFLLSALLSASTAHAQTQPDTRAAVATTDPWATSAATDAPQYTTGWSTAPGMSLSLHQKPSTDYWGRPLKQKAARRPKPVAVVEPADDPMMRSSGVMIAPGMNTAPYRGVSTDYQGRPLRKPAQHGSGVAAKAGKAVPVAVVTPPRW